jgi:LPS sulfotransferase NodH
MAPYDAYVICTSPRSGSTLLCKLLAATGVAGKPDSHFHRPSLTDWLAEYRLTPDPAASEREVLADVFRAAIAEGRGGTGIFGLRLQRHSFDYFTDKLAVLHPAPGDDAQRFEAAFGKTLFVHLTRPDKVEQAVSYVRAQQSGLWHVAPDGTELERLAPHREPAYDGAEIRASVEIMTAYDREWEQWFAAEGVEPVRLTYDALAADPLGTLRQVLERLGQDIDAARGIGPSVRKLADGISHDWVTRFRAERPGA